MSRLPPNSQGIPYNIEKQLRDLHNQYQSIVSQLQQGGFLTKAQADTLYGPPLPIIKRSLQAGSQTQLDVTGLSGLLAQPQQGGAPLLEAAPIQGSPQAQDGALYRIKGADTVLRFWDGATDPGVDTPVTATGTVVIRHNNTGTVGTEGTLDFFDSSFITWAISISGSEIRLTPALSGVLASVLTASATLDFPSTSAQSSSDLTIIVTGAALSDLVILGVPNASVNANSSYSAWVSASNTVTVRFLNASSGSIDPSSGTFKVAVLHF